MGKFVVGDIVVHRGTEMAVEDYFEGETDPYGFITPPYYECVWFENFELKRSKFHTTEVVSRENWEKILIQKHRDERLDNILNFYNRRYRL